MNSLAKRRSLLTIATLLLVVMFTGSCKKFLDLKPQNSITRDNFFKSKDDAQAAIVGCYDALQACVTQFVTWGEFRGDLVQSTSLTALTYENLDKTLSYCDWTTMYTMIGRVNTVLAFVPQIPSYDNGFSVDDSKKILAEALYMRALGYFYLVRTFNQVPLVLQAPSDDKVNFFLPKSPADTILNQIETDLATAEASIPVQYDKNADFHGRVTKAAVNALQTDVYLWRAKYQQAVDASQKVLDSKLYTLVRGDSWFNIFSQKNTTESIFEVQFDYSLTETNNLIGAVGAYGVSSTLKGYFDGAADVYRGVNNTYVNNTQYWKYQGLTTVTQTARTGNDPNFILYRLPDVLLMQAEALIHLGSSAQKIKAIQLLDSVHVRAGLAPYDINRGGYLDGNNAPYSLLIELIMQERAMELSAEGKRWFDLVRVATNDANPDYLINKVLQSRSVGDRTLIRSRIIDPRGWYMPIYQNELYANPLLVQNPYYH